MRRVPARRAGDDRQAGPADGADAASRSHGPPAVSGPRSSASRRRRSRSGRGLVMYGIRSKFHGGGGEVVYHSSVSPSHGSLPARRPAARRHDDVHEEDQHADPIRYEPTVEIML